MKTKRGADPCAGRFRRHVMLMIDPPIPQRFDGIMRFARGHGWRITLANRLVRAPRGWSGDGAIVTLRDDPAVARFAEGLRGRGVPVVDITCHRPEMALPRAIPDYEGAGRMAAAHFREIGIRRCVWFSTEWSAVQAGFCRGLEEGMAGVSEPVSRIVLSKMVSRSRLDDADRFAKAVGTRLVALRKPVGVLTYNDEDAARILSLCLDVGIAVPEECAILGIGNDSFVCENQPVPLSSVNDDLEGNGYAGAELLERLMDGEAAPAAPVLVPCRGVVARRSTDALLVENPVLRKALSILAADLARPPSMTQLSESVGVSRSTLDRLFLRELGRPAHAELLRRRIVRAKDMLRDTTLAVSDISAECGFCNPGYFAVAFARSEGVTPAKWRRCRRNWCG